MKDLSPRYEVRRPTPADAELVHGVIAAHQRATIGRLDYTLDDVRDELRLPDADLDSNAWLVLDADGTGAGWGWAWPAGDAGTVEVDVFAPDAEVADALWDAVRERAAGIARERGWPSVTVHAGAYREDTAAAARLAGYGFEVGTTYYRMRIDHAGPVTPPPPPAGFVARSGTESEQVRRDAHAVREAAFHDHYGHVRRDFEEWAAHLESGSAHDWAFLTVLYTEAGEPAGVVLRSTQFVPDERCGYVRMLGVHPAFQGRGLGRWLLRHAFAEDARAGYVGSMLHVDTNPERPALGLYLSEGMRAAVVIDAWRRPM